ncbi:MAG: hypothetical protein KBT32_08260 [Bacteroidales bacterium]|nr:hypothetical protein [Candidatus Physcocola equi]
MQITKILTDYVKAIKTDYAIMINGEWGAGKSWLWRNVLSKEIEKINTTDSTTEDPIHYKAITISLFGVSTPEDLRSRIFEETCGFLNNKYVKTGIKLIGFGANKLANYFNIGDVKRNNVADIFTDLSINLNHYVLCFDDLERIKPSILIELLGYINTLIEQDNVKVIFICNENELKDDNYHNYKEKVVRFTHTVKADIESMVEEFVGIHTNKTYSAYLRGKSEYIASIYKKGECYNLRTLKFNIDIFERIFDIVRTTIQPYEEKHVTEITNYMLLLSMIYCIEYRRDNNKRKLRSLSSITRSWSYNIDTLERIKQITSKSEIQSIENKKNEIQEYQQSVRQRYFSNTYIYGSSEAIINYLLTGYLNEEAIRTEILTIDQEAQRYVATEEKQLFETLSQLWDTNDEDMAKAVNKTLERVKETSFQLVDYPTFFLCLQRLHLFEFIDLKMSVEDLQKIFEDAIDRCNHTSYFKDINAYYDNNPDISTTEYELLVGKVKDKNAALYSSIIINKFETVVRDIKSIEQLTSYRRLDSNIFQQISASEFFNLFLQYDNRRKREYWTFFDERYKYHECYLADKDFIIQLKAIMNKYTSNPETPISGTKQYCCKLIDLFEKKMQIHEASAR